MNEPLGLIALMVSALAVIVSVMGVRVSRQSLNLSRGHDLRGVTLFVEPTFIDTGREGMVRAIHVRAVNIGHRPVTVHAVYLFRVHFDEKGRSHLIIMLPSYVPGATDPLPKMLNDGESLWATLLEREFLDMLDLSKETVVAVVAGCDDAERNRHYGVPILIRATADGIESFSDPSGKNL